MASRNTRRPAPAATGNRPSKADLPGGLIDLDNTDTNPKEQAELLLIDRFGKRHSLAVLSSWSVDAIRAMELRFSDDTLARKMADEIKRHWSAGLSGLELKNAVWEAFPGLDLRAFIVVWREALRIRDGGAP